MTRERAIYILKNTAWLGTEENLAEVEKAISILEEAEPRRGRWKRTKAYPNINFCSECGEPFEKSNSNDKWNYCPNCGTKMEKK